MDVTAAVTPAHARRALRARRGSGWHYALYAWCALVFFFLMAPLVVVFPISLSSSSYLQFPPPGWSWRWYHAYFQDPTWMEATWRSLKVAACTTVLATVLGTMLAFSLVRGRYPGKSILNQASLLPLVVPVIVYSIAVYAMFGYLKLIGMWQAIVLGHTVHAIPFVVIIVGAALRTFDIAQEHAAMSLGASRAMAIWRVTLPQIRPSLVSAAFLAFISSFDELVVAMFLGGSNMTLPKKMFDNIVNEIDPTIAAVSVVQIVLVIVVLADRLARRQRRRAREIGGLQERAANCSVRKSLRNGEPAVRSRTTSCSTRARCAPSCERGRSRPRMIRSRFGIAGRNGTTATGIAGDASSENGSTIATPAPASARSMRLPRLVDDDVGLAAATGRRRERTPQQKADVGVFAEADERHVVQVAHGQRAARRQRVLARNHAHRLRLADHLAVEIRVVDRLVDEPEVGLAARDAVGDLRRRASPATRCGSPAARGESARAAGVTRLCATDGDAGDGQAAGVAFAQLLDERRHAAHLLAHAHALPAAAPPLPGSDRGGRAYAGRGPARRPARSAAATC